MLDWKNMAAYSVTLAILVLGPVLISLFYNYGYIFSMIKKLRSGAPIHDKGIKDLCCCNLRNSYNKYLGFLLEYATALAENLANPSHIMSFLLVFIFWLSWTPYIGITIYESITGNIIDNPLLHFGAVWIGILNSFWKVVIMSMMSPQFRLALRIFCLTICCRTKVIIEIELIMRDLIGNS